jgi:hypothetical protein
MRWRQSLPGMLAQHAEHKLDLNDTAALIVDSSFPFDRRLRAALPSVPYVSVLDTVCPSQRCPAFVDDVPMAFDMNPLTREASIMVVDAITPAPTRTCTEETPTVRPFRRAGAPQDEGTHLAE